MWKYYELRDELGVVEKRMKFCSHLRDLYVRNWVNFRSAPFISAYFREKSSKMMHFHQNTKMPVYHPHSTDLRPDSVHNQIYTAFRPIIIAEKRFLRGLIPDKNVHQSAYRNA